MSNPWDERYRSEEFFYGVEPNDFLAQEAHRIRSGGRVLCLAEGEGRNAVWLAQQGFDVLGIDGSAVGLAKAERLALSRGVRITTQVADLAEADLGDGEWDAVVSIWCHVPPPLRRDLHQRVQRALVPGGVFMLEAYHPKQLEYRTGGPPVAELMMTANDLRSELDGLQIDVLQEIEREVQEGPGHHGHSAVTQLIAARPA